MATAFLQQRASASAAGIRLVKSLLQRKTFNSPQFSPQAFTTTQLYRLAIKEPVPKDFQPYPFTPKEVPKAKGPQVPQAAAPAEVFPPHPEHPVRSIRFLKTEILARLEAKRFIRLVRTPRVSAAVEAEVDETAKDKKKTQKKSHKVDYLWKVVDPKTLRKRPQPKAPEPIFGREVGVGLDISHLNKRRQRARLGKIRRDVQLLRTLQQSTEKTESIETTSPSA